jgi:hypothetical protein
MLAVIYAQELNQSTILHYTANTHTGYVTIGGLQINK